MKAKSFEKIITDTTVMEKAVAYKMTTGVPLVCEATADKKNAQWKGVKHTK